MGAPSSPVVALSLLILLSAIACERRGPSRDRPDDGLTGGELVFQDRFERADLGDDWHTTSDAWRLEDGAVHVQDARNAPLWLNETLPERVRVEFDVVAEHPDGDLKFEIFGNGRDHQSGYVAIFGGWHNQVTCIARLDEHGDDRLDAPQHDPVEVGRTYHFAAVRTDSRLRWHIDGELVLSYDDPDPLEGPGHDHFAFSNWAVPARLDNLEIYDLPD